MSGPDRPEYQWGNEGQSDPTQAFPTPPPPPAQPGGFTPQPWSQQPGPPPQQGGWGQPPSNPSTPAWGIPSQPQAQPTWQQPPPPPNTGQQWGQPAQPWPQPDYGQYQQQPPGGKSKTPLIIGGIAAVVVILALIVGAYFMFFRAKVLDQEAVQKGVQSVLTDSYDLQNVTDVKCPKDEKVEVNASFTCSVTVDGESRTVTIKIIDEDGTYEVSKPQ
jgi:hypothetical protein